MYKNKLKDHWSKRTTSRKKRRKAVQRTFTENNFCREVGPNSSLKFKMFTSLLPAEATHTTLDLFEKQSLLVTFDNAFTQKVGPSYSPDGPMHEFEVMDDRNNFKDLQKLLLQIECKISQINDGDLRTRTDATNTDSPYLSNNALCLLTVLKFPTEITTNGNYSHKAFIETEFSSGKTAKNTWLVCQEYSYEDEPAKIDGTDGRFEDFTVRKALVANSNETIK